jgi:hypothetical protein
MATINENVIFNVATKGTKETRREVSNTAVSVDDLVSQFRRAERALKDAGVQQEQFTRKVRNSNGNYKENASGMRMMRGGAAQFGYQIQDVAVQLQMGQNAMMVFAQQGSQIASIFGPGGAALGAVIAIGGALGSVLMKMNKAGEATKNLGDEIKALGRDYEKLTDAQTGFLLNQEKIAIKSEEETQAAIQKEMESLKGMVDLYNKLVNETDPFVKAQSATSIAFIEANYNIEESVTKLEELRAAYDTSTQKVGAHKAEMDALNGVYQTTAEGIKEYYDALAEGTDRDSKAAKARLDERIALEETLYNVFKGFDEKRKEDAMAEVAMEEMLYETFKGIEEKKLEDKKKAKQEELDLFFDTFAEEVRLAEEKEQKLKALNDAVLQNTGDMFGGIAANLKEGTRAQQAFLAVQKGIAVAQAIMNLNTAISSANTVPFPGNLAAIAQAIATGTNAIAGIKTASFEGGGYTGMGARAGGIDGKGGFPAILHPNETVIDHTQGGGNKAVTVNFNITANDTDGFDKLLASRRGQIVSMVNQAVNNRGRPSLA